MFFQFLQAVCSFCKPDLICSEMRSGLQKWKKNGKCPSERACLPRALGPTWTPLGHFCRALRQGNTTNDQARCVKAMGCSKALIFHLVLSCLCRVRDTFCIGCPMVLLLWGALGNSLVHLGGALGQGNTTNDKARCVKAMGFSNVLIFHVFYIMS